MNDKNKDQISPQENLVYQITYIKPPPQPVKMEITEYIELLEKINKSSKNLQEAALKALSEYQVKLDNDAEELAAKLRVIFSMKPNI